MSTSKKDAPYHHGNLRAALVAAASAKLEAGGPEAVTLRAVASDVGVSAMAPYRHFADKAELLSAVAAEGFGALRLRLEEADRAREARDALAAQGVAYVGFALEHPALFRLMFGPGHFSDDDLNQKASGAYGVLQGRVEAMTRGAPQPELVLGVWSMVHGLAALLVDGRAKIEGADRETTVRGLTQLFARFVEFTADGKG